MDKTQKKLIAAMVLNSMALLINMIALVVKIMN